MTAVDVDPAHRAAWPGTALLTDHYELTMLDAALRSGAAERRAVFEVFARELPPGRRYGVVAGTGRLAEAIAAFRFDDEELAFLERTRVVSQSTLAWLAGFRFRGQVDGYAEGEVFFPNSPVLTVDAPFGEATLLETVVLSILNHDSAVAAAASRMSLAASPAAGLIEMGGRRTHESAAVAAARAAYLAGFTSTSNLEAGRRHGIPTAGTAAHAFTMIHDDEREAFVAQLEVLGLDTTLLVDTYETEQGLRNALDAARSLGAAGPGAVRIDCGDLAVETRRARALLDDAGAAATRIVVSGDLDEYSIARLERDPRGRAPVDAYGVGTRLVTGSGHPTAGMVYKLVAVGERPGRDAPLRPVAKRQTGKATIGGRKHAWRLLGTDGRARAETFTLSGTPVARARPLQVRYLRGGEPLDGATLDEVRRHHAAARAELPDEALDLEPGEAAFAADLVLDPESDAGRRPEGPEREGREEP